MATTKNRNDSLIKNVGELHDEISFSDFIYRRHFVKICELHPDNKNERIIIANEDGKYIDACGLIYVFVAQGKIFKIGQTINTIASRVNSYNCGRKLFRARGTCSTTNYFVLQSFLAMNVTVSVYAYLAKKQKYTIFGEHGEDIFPSTKVIERKIIKDFVETHGKKPIGNTQN